MRATHVEAPSLDDADRRRGTPTLDGARGQETVEPADGDEQAVARGVSRDAMRASRADPAGQAARRGDR